MKFNAKYLLITAIISLSFISNFVKADNFTYSCSGNSSIETISGVNTTINSIQCQYGCNGNNSISYYQNRIPQGDLCNISPFYMTLEEMAIGFGFIFFVIFLLFVIRKVGRI